jgi:uncharacterized membrane protein
MLYDFLGRLHPALVHLPIGILLIAVCFELLTNERRFAAVRAALPTLMFWGMIASLLSAATGWVLASGGDYEEDLVEPHRWTGLALALVSVILYILYRKRVKLKFIKAGALLTLVLILVAGHLGGSITHGEDFLSFQGDGEEGKAIMMKPIPDIQQAYVYNDIVEPLLQSRCYGCHGTKKQKGKLRLDLQDYIIKGGESGKAIVPGNPEESEMIERLLLPLADDDHMPPPRKPQLTHEQVSILKWWVATGADFHKKVSELAQPESIKPVLLALETGKSLPKEEIELAPADAVEPAPAAAITRLNSAGISILPLSRESNYLTANFINISSASDTLMDELLSLKKQLVSLKMDGIAVNRKVLETIAQLKALRKLQISNSTLADEGSTHLSKLDELRSLNVVGSSVTAKGLSELKGLKNLKYIYLYKTNIAPAERDQLASLFPTAKFDFGNYSLPLLEGDTSEIKF